MPLAFAAFGEKHHGQPQRRVVVVHDAH